MWLLMNECWDLTPLYSGFDDPAFLQDVQQLRAKTEELVAFVPQLEGIEFLEGLRRGTRLLEELAVLEDRLLLYPRLRTSVNTDDAEAVSWQGRLGSISAVAAGAQSAFKQWAGGLPQLEALLEQDEVLQQYRFYYTQLAESRRYLLSSQQEDTLAAMGISGLRAWGNLRSAVTSRMRVDFRGQNMTMAGVRNLARDPDMAVRRDAYIAELAGYEAVKEPVAHAMNAIKQSTITECRMRGYESVLDWSLKQANMQRATLDAMLSAVVDYLPKLRRYMKAKAKLLGYPGGLPWYDMMAPVGKGSGSFTVEEARDHLLKLFAGFDPEMASMMETAFRDAWIDFHPRSGKRDGAFCASSRSMHRSWVLTNYSGKLAAVCTLAHELGHAYHNICIGDHRPLNKRYGRPVSETASTFNECVVYGAAVHGAKDRDEKLGLIEGCLISEAAMIVDIYSRFLFEDEVFRRRETEFLSADTLCDIMKRAQKEAFGDGLDHNALHPYMWICKPHYYSAFYYNYPYIFGSLFSRGLYARYLAEGASFVPKYKKLLYTTAVASVEDAAAVADIDLTDKAFWTGALRSVAELVDEFCELVEEKV